MFVLLIWVNVICTNRTTPVFLTGCETFLTLSSAVTIIFKMPSQVHKQKQNINKHKRMKSEYALYSCMET